MAKVRVTVRDEFKIEDDLYAEDHSDVESVGVVDGSLIVYYASDRAGSIPYVYAPAVWLRCMEVTES